MKLFEAFSVCSVTMKLVVISAIVLIGKHENSFVYTRELDLIITSIGLLDFVNHNKTVTLSNIISAVNWCSNKNWYLLPN